jgi:hypothetical protein
LNPDLPSEKPMLEPLLHKLSLIVNRSFIIFTQVVDSIIESTPIQS